jgi:hypothetical protein
MLVNLVTTRHVHAADSRVESRTPHWLFVVDLETAAAVLDGMKSEGRLYSAVIGPVRPGGLDATRALS